MAHRDLPADEAVLELDVLRRENDTLRAVLGAMAQASAELDAEVAIDAILAAAQDIFGADRCVILLGSPRTNFRSVRGSRGLSAAYLRHLESGHLPLQTTLEQQGALIVPNLLDDPPFAIHPPVLALMREEGIRAVSAVGLRHAGALLGALILYFDRPHAICERELELVRGFADHAAAALVHAEDFELINQLRTTRERSEQRLEAILDKLRDLVIVWNPEMEVLVANAPARAFIEATGLGPDCLPPETCCPVRQVFRDAAPVVGCEAQIGDRVYAIDCHPLFDEATGELIAVVEHARDVTINHRLQRELAYREERMRIGMEKAPVAILELEEPSGRIVQTNQMAAAWSGYEIESLIGRPFEELIAEEDRPRLRDACQEARDTGQAVIEGCTLVGAGEPQPISMSLGLIRFRSGQSCMQVIARDIRKRLQIQAQLVEQEKLAAIGQLASGVAHELRNPLGIIASALYDLDEILDSDDPDVQEDLKIARDEIQRVQEIINNVLDFARGSAPEREWVDLDELLRQAVALLGKSMATRDIEVVLELEPVSEIWANRGTMRQVVLNLLTNSYQATPDGGTVRVGLGRSDHDHVLLTVSDTGEGIPKDALSRIFNPFYTTKAPGQGTGLGLSIVYSTVREHGGEITVESERGQGTTFRITLPRRGETETHPERPNPLIAAADELL